MNVHKANVGVRRTKVQSLVKIVDVWFMYFCALCMYQVRSALCRMKQAGNLKLKVFKKKSYGFPKPSVEVNARALIRTCKL